MLRGPVLAAAAALTLMGCATQPEAEYRAELRPGESFASHIARAAGIDGIEDAPSEAVAAQPGLGSGLVRPSDIRSIGYTVLNVLNPVGGQGALTAGLGAGLMAFVSTPTNVPAEHSAIVGWAPADFADTPEEAREKFWSRITEAFEDAIASVRPAASERSYRQYAKTPRGDEALDFYEASWSEAACVEMAEGRCLLRLLSGAGAPPKLEEEPAALGGGQAWAFTHHEGMVAFDPVAEDDAFFKRYYAAMDDLSIYIEASKRLPEWVFIYVAPLRAGFQAEDRPRLYPAPIVLNQGRAHYFVEGARRGEARTAQAG
jgi:hypothetical protein